MSQAPSLTTERLLLRPVIRTDLDALAAIRADTAVGRYTGGTKTRQDVWFTMLRTVGLWSMLGYGYWTVCERQTGTVIGEVGFADFLRDLKPDISGSPEAGWIIAPTSWGKGYAGEAVGAAHDWLDQTQPSRSVCIIGPDNLASLKIAHKFNYKEQARTKLDGDPIIILARQTPG